MNLKYCLKVGCLTLWFIVSPIVGWGQVNKPNEAENSARIVSENAEVNRWNSTLDLLFSESKSISEKDKRAMATAEIADAYWQIDTVYSQDLFNEAVDIALTADEKKEKEKSIRYILSLATKRNTVFAKTLIEKIKSKKKFNNEIEEISIQAAQELLNEDVRKSAEFAEAVAPAGLMNGSAMLLIFQITQKDADLGNRVYKTYLEKALAQEQLPPDLLILLAGYTFGNSEFYSLSRQSPYDYFGASLRLPEPISANPSQSRQFLNSMFVRLNQLNRTTSQTVSSEQEFNKKFILFATQYLIDQVAIFSPNNLDAWEQLKNQSVIGVGNQQILEVQNTINSIKADRERIKRLRENQKNNIAEQDEISAEEIEKIPDVCRRDVLYTNIVLRAIYKKDFEKAEKILKEIEDLGQNAKVKDYLYFTKAQAVAEKNEWEDIDNYFKRISDSRINTILQVQIAKKAIENNQVNYGVKLLRDLEKKIDKLQDPNENISLLFETASIWAIVDKIEAGNLFSKAIKLMNRQNKFEQKRYSILIKVPLSCAGQEEWFGGSVSLSRGDLLNATPIVAKDNADNLISIVQNIDDISTKIKTSTLIINQALISDKKLEKQTR